LNGENSTHLWGLFREKSEEFLYHLRMKVSHSSWGLLSSLLIALILQGCGAASTSSSDSGDPRVTIENKSITLSGATSLITLGTLLTLNATINPPTGEYADDIFVKGTNAYVSYNVPGATALGAIDQLNVTTPTAPVRTATFNSTLADINGVYVDSSNNVYAIGGDGVNGSLLYQLSVSSNAFSAISTTTYLPSFAGTGVRVWGSSLYTLTGDTGGLNIFTPGSQTTTAVPTTAISDARGMDQKGTSNLWVVAGGGNLYEMNAAGAILNTLTYAGANNIAESKSAVHVSSTVMAVSLGSQGAALVCMTDKNKIVTIPAPVVNGLAATSTVTNSVTFGNGLLFVANGLAGVYVYSITNPLINNLVGGLTGTNSACGSMELTFQGSMDLGSANQYSANNVYYLNGILYVATGAGGFKVITVNLSLLALVTGLLSSI
jgi:hypothetical protein